MLARSNLSERAARAPTTAATTGVRLAELLGRLSLAFDIAHDASYGKGVRAVVLAVELGRLAGANKQELSHPLWLSLLGYLDSSDKLAHIVGAGPRVVAALAEQRGVQ